MSFNPTITVEDKGGTVKKISASHITRDMRADAVWHSAYADVITSVPCTLSNEHKEWVVWERTGWVAIGFASDSGADNGQGYSVQGSGLVWEVTDVSGKVYIIRCQYVGMGDDKAAIFDNQNRVEANKGDKLFAGDAILAEKDASFTVKVNIGEADAGFTNYTGLGVVQMCL